MYNLLISLAAGAVTAVLIHLLGFGWIAGIVPGALVMFGVYILLARRIAQQVTALGEQAQGALQNIRTEKDKNAALDKAVKILEEGYKLEKWQYFVAPEIHANVGMLQYMKKDYPAALPNLAKSSNRNWMAKTMLGCVHYLNKAEGPMKQAFEDSVQNAGKKEAMAWAVYIWCLNKLGKNDEALAVAGRAVAENPNEEKLKKLQGALQNDKRIKMNAFEPMWWQFGLEAPPTQVQYAQPWGSRFPGRRRR